MSTLPPRRENALINTLAANGSGCLVLHGLALCFWLRRPLSLVYVSCCHVAPEDVIEVNRIVGIRAASLLGTTDPVKFAQSTTLAIASHLSFCGRRAMGVDCFITKKVRVTDRPNFFRTPVPQMISFLIPDAGPCRRAVRLPRLLSAVNVFSRNIKPASDHTAGLE